MKRLSIALAIVTWCAALPAMAQQNAPARPSTGANTAVAPSRTAPIAAPAPTAAPAPAVVSAPVAAPAPTAVQRPAAPSRQGGQTDNRLVQSSLTASSGMVEPTPEMWLYEQQLREYLDPGMAVRRNAEFRSAQRRNRMASLKWFGFSNQRPNASPDPYNGEYSPAWVGSSGLYPYRWSGGDTVPWVALRPGTAAY
jgi:hypothetical protein